MGGVPVFADWRRPGWGWYAATVAMGLLSAVLSSGMNNLPEVMIVAIAVDGADTGGWLREALVCANVIGSDLGPKMTRSGSTRSTSCGGTRGLRSRSSPRASPRRRLPAAP